MRRTPVKRIAVFAQNKAFFGALLVQFPLYQHLRLNFPEAEIRIYSTVSEADLFLKYNLGDNIVLYKKSSISNFWKISSSLKSYRPDIIINCREHSEQLHLIIALSKAKTKIGFRPSSLMRIFYDRTVPYSPLSYRGINFLNLINLLDLPKKVEFEGIKSLGDTSHLTADGFRKKICLIPGGGEGEFKRWGIENFLALCKQYLIMQPDTCFFFILGHKEEEYINSIRKDLPEKNLKMLFKVGVQDMVKAILSSDVVVANDCGPSHLAQMCKSNYISIWGWGKQSPYTRISEWFFPHEKATYVVSGEGENIKTIPPDKVLPHLIRLAGS